MVDKGNFAIHYLVFIGKAPQVPGAKAERLSVVLFIERKYVDPRSSLVDTDQGSFLKMLPELMQDLNHGSLYMLRIDILHTKLNHTRTFASGGS
jgi:hypothetical protein